MLDHKYDIFLSYSSKDKDIARRVHDYLSAKKYKVWLDEVEVLTGDDIVRKVFEGIKESRFFALLLTHNSTESKWVKEELSAARIRELEEGKVVVLPLIYEDCNIPESLLSKRYADFRYSFQQGLYDLEKSLRGYEQRLSGKAAEGMLSQTESELHLEQSKNKLVNAINGTEELYLAMDLGGTKAYVSLMNGEAERLFDRKFSTESHENADMLFEFIKRCIRDTIDMIHEICGISAQRVSNRLEALSIGFAGPTDFERGVILDAPHFRIRNFPLAEKLRQTFDIPTFVDNDVNLGVLGESWKGVAKGYKNVVGIIIGTGIGGGIMIDGQVYRGKNKTAGEVGHMVLDFNNQEICACGQHGCFEVFASRQSLARDLHKRKSEKDADNLIWEEKNLGSNEIAYYFNIGDNDAIEIITRAAEICGKAVFSILNILNPEIVFFGGGFIRQVGDVFLEPVREEAKKCMNAVYSSGENNIPIEIGMLDNPILVGACKIAVDNTTGKRQHSKSSIIDIITTGLNENDLRLLHSFYRQEMPIPISKDPTSDFCEGRLRALRNRGLIQTVGDQSFRKSTRIQITKLGKIIVEETL